MAGSTASNYQHQKFMEELLLNTAYTPPATLYLALFTTVPNLDGTGGTEVSTSGTAYARQSIAAGSAQWDGPAGSNLEYSNKSDITFSTPTADWGTITGAGLYDAASGGNLIYTSTLTSSKQVNNGDGAPRVLAGQLRISRAYC